jgi:hypothetical protein
VRVLTIVLCVVLASGCLDPEERRPGLRLSGEAAPEPVLDWSFTDEYPEIYLETRPSYLVPHSVTIVCASLEDRLYVGARNPTEKRWVGHVGRNPDVRLKIGDNVYEARLERVSDPGEIAAVYGAYARKYGWEPEPRSERPEVWYFRVLARNPR